jgi:hypothetical protein
MALMRATVAGNFPRMFVGHCQSARAGVPWSQADREQPVSRAQFKRGACDV